MVMLIWFILSRFGVCNFTWLPVFIDALISSLFFTYTSFSSKNENKNLVKGLAAYVGGGVAVFAFYKFFFGLVISPWWLLLSPIAILIALLFPGGFTLINCLFDKFELITLPTWGLVLGIIIDILILGLIIFAFIDDRKKSK